MAEALHIPVMLQEVAEHLAIPKGGRVLDLTLGLGGHAEAMLARADNNVRYLGIDRDCEAVSIASQRLGGDERFSAIAATYEAVWEAREFEDWAAKCAPDGFDVILADLGVSGLQLKTPSRGFSFMAEGPLDMRMDSKQRLTAFEWLKRQTEESLAKALFKYGEERASRAVSKAILNAMADGKLLTTLDLAKAVYSVLPRKTAAGKKQIDPATRTFQAIRISVNSELSGLGKAIEKAAAALKTLGRIGVISFHSLEDRIVKRALRRLAGLYDGPGRRPPSPLPKYLQLISPGGIVPSEGERLSNPSSRSARLRLAQRVPCCI